MNKKDLDRYLDIILKEEEDNPTITWEQISLDGGKISLNLRKVELLDATTLPNYDLNSINFNLLESLYSRIESKSQEEIFFNRLEKDMENIIFGNSSKLAFLFLMRRRDISKTIQHFFQNLTLSILNIGSLDILSSFIKYEFEQINDDELELIKLSINPNSLDFRIKGLDKDSSDYDSNKRISNTIETILQQIHEIEYERIRGNLFEGVNFEINQDKEALQSNLKSLGFSKTLQESLDYIERQFRSSDDEFDYKSCAGHIRSFASGVIKEIAIKVAQSEGTDLPKKSYSKYLKDQKFFHGSREAEFLQAFTNYLSANSVHKLNSEREVARIGKNIAIEFALLLSQRLEGLTSNN